MLYETNVQLLIFLVFDTQVTGVNVNVNKGWDLSASLNPLWRRNDCLRIRNFHKYEAWKKRFVTTSFFCVGKKPLNMLL